MLLYFLRFFHSKDIAGQLTSWPTEAPLVRCPTSLICCAFIFVIFLLGEMSEQLISRLFRPLPNLLLAQASPINCLRVPRKGECTLYKYKYQVPRVPRSTKYQGKVKVQGNVLKTLFILSHYVTQQLSFNSTYFGHIIIAYWCFYQNLESKSSSHLGGEYSPGLCLGSPGISSGKSSLRTSPEHHYHYHHCLSQQWNLTKLRRGNSLPHRPARVVVNVSYMPAEVAVVTVVSHPHLVLGKVGVFCARTSAVRTNTRSQHHFSQGPETHQTDFPSKCKI